MKRSSRTLPPGAMALWLCASASSHAQLRVNYDFTPGAIVLDANGQLSIVYDNSGLPGVQRDLGGLSGLASFTDVDVRLQLSTGSPGNPMYLGDLYSSLTFGNSSETQRTAVLLNRPGRDNNNAFGSSLGSLNVTLDDSASINVFNATGNGTYQADGRLLVNPNGVGVAFSPGSNGLSALNGTPLSSNRVSLLVADFSAGGIATLSGWGFSTTGVAASSGTFIPGANSSLGDTGSGDSNTIGAILDTTGASGGSLQLNFAGTTTFSNGITGSAGITKTGGGSVTLENTSDYSGATAVNAGTLAVNGMLTNSAVTVANSATLAGTGGISSSVTIQSGGSLATGGGGIETLATGTLSLQAGSTLAHQLNSSVGDAVASDLLKVSGNLNLLGTVGLTLSDLALTPVAFDVGDIFSLVNYTGTWNGGMFTVSGNELADEEEFTLGLNTWRISYNDATGGLNHTTEYFGGSDSFVNLHAVPEPRAALLGGLGLLMLLRRRR